jgi:hypothetical protein
LVTVAVSGIGSEDDLENPQKFKLPAPPEVFLLRASHNGSKECRNYRFNTQ